jgi:hypothetical protein
MRPISRQKKRRISGMVIWREIEEGKKSPKELPGRIAYKISRLLDNKAVYPFDTNEYVLAGYLSVKRGQHDKYSTLPREMRQTSQLGIRSDFYIKNLPEETLTIYSILLSSLYSNLEILSLPRCLYAAFSLASVIYDSAIFIRARIAIICESFVFADTATSASFSFTNDSTSRTDSAVAKLLTCNSLPNTLTRCEEFN